MTQETFFLENRTGRQFSRIVAALAWPHGIAQGCVIVLGEIRGRPAVLNVHNHVHVLNEYRSGDVADLVDMAVRLYEDWSASCVITPGDDRRVVFLDAINDDLRRERRRRIRITDPQAMEREWGAGTSFLLGHPSAAYSGGEDAAFRDGLHGGVRDAAAWERRRGQADDGLPRSRGASVGRSRDGLEPAARGREGTPRSGGQARRVLRWRNGR